MHNGREENDKSTKTACSPFAGARVLIVEDDPSINDVISSALAQDGYVCTCAYSGTEARMVVESGESFDIVLCDLMLPGLSGEELIARIRERCDVPILVASAKGEASDRVALLRMGADDYVVKPFSPRELVARVRAVLNRTMPRPTEAADTMTFGELTIDTASHTVRVSGEEVALTPKEFDLLVFLASNKGIALSREKILQKVWNYDYFGEDRTVDTHVKMLRGHLGKCRSYIATVWGIGYKFDPDAAR